ncbi:alpha-2C adrenergic receptor [Hydra vulgaris]|uniref:alpha-2C adrenergic receptor n=1 Tax=Hydra vulgaris TaxID=6087 RepID=UPI00064163E9|nr:alpha-2C adrenergic receptor [Hydra vulgaris]
MFFNNTRPQEMDLLTESLLSGIYSFAFVIGVFGNTLVLLATLRYRKLQIPTNLFVCNLCFNDILILLAGVPVFLNYEGTGFMEGIKCVFLKPILRILMMANVLILVIIAFERYLVILRIKMPFKINNKTSILICLIVNILAILLGLPNILLKQKKEFNSCHLDDFTGTSTLIYVLLVFLLQYIAPLVIMSFLYIKIWYTVRSKNRKSIKVFNRNRTKSFLNNNNDPFEAEKIDNRSEYQDSTNFNYVPKRMAKRRSISLTDFNDRHTIRKAEHFSLSNARSLSNNLEDCRENRTMKTLKRNSSINRRKSGSVLCRTSSMVQETKRGDDKWFETKSITRCASARMLSHSDSELKTKTSRRKISSWYNSSFRMPMSKMKESVTSLIAGADLNEISEEFAFYRFKQTLKTLKVFGILLTVFFVCMLPHHVSEILIAFHVKITPKIHYFCKGLVYCNASLNPWLYGGFNEYFQNAFKSLLIKSKKRKKANKKKSIVSCSRLSMGNKNEASIFQRLLNLFFSKWIPDERAINGFSKCSPILPRHSTTSDKNRKISNKKISCRQVEIDGIPICAPIIIITSYDDDINSPFV